MPLSDIEAYFRKYDKASYGVFACQGFEPTEAEISGFEQEIGFKLPAEFREFTMSPLGCLYMEVREGLWPRPKPYEVGPFWSFLYAIKVFGITANAPDWLDIRVQAREFQETGEKGLVPFMQIVGSPDRYCFNPQGQIIAWQYDLPSEREVVNLSFSDLLMKEIHELEQRKERKLKTARG